MTQKPTTPPPSDKTSQHLVDAMAYAEANDMSVINSHLTPGIGSVHLLQNLSRFGKHRVLKYSTEDRLPVHTIHYDLQAATRQFLAIRNVQEKSRLRKSAKTDKRAVKDRYESMSEYGAF